PDRAFDRPVDNGSTLCWRTRSRIIFLFRPRRRALAERGGAARGPGCGESEGEQHHLLAIQGIHAAIARGAGWGDIALLVFQGARACGQRNGTAALGGNKCPVDKVVKPLQVFEVDNSVRAVSYIWIEPIYVALGTRRRDWSVG